MSFLKKAVKDLERGIDHETKSAKKETKKFGEKDAGVRLSHPACL